MKARWIVKAVARQDRVQMQTMRHGQYLAIISNPIYSTEARNKAWDAAAETIDKVESLLCPWLDREEERRDQNPKEQLTRMWADAWGDPTDPEVAARIQATAEWLERTNKADQPRRA